MKTWLQFWYIRIHRYVIKSKFIKIMEGPLAGLKWTTGMNYEYLTGTYLGEDEQEVINELRRKNNSVFFDIGANVGYFSIYVATACPNCEVEAFEPIPGHLVTIRDHIRINNVKRVTVQEMAVADTTGELVFSNFSDSEGNTYKSESALFKNATNTLKVKSTSIDDFVELHQKFPTMIKIDVEGAELDVLKGGIKTIQQYKPTIILATHDCHVPGIKQQCLDFLDAANYTTSILGAHNKYVPGLEDFLARPKVL